MERKGKKLQVLADGHPRRLADGRNAWRKMSEAQRRTFLAWVLEQHASGETKVPYPYALGEER